LDEIARLESLGGAEVNEAKKVLATAATALLHGREAAEMAADTARTTFEAGGAAENLPTHIVDAASLQAGISLVQLLTESGLCASKSEARRLIRGGGARINDEPVTDEDVRIGGAELRDGAIKLSAGRKQHRLVRVAD
jgi:tyrosyl-tRNA synthetase